jgi:flagellin-like hook-associated protein FlgL
MAIDGVSGRTNYLGSSILNIQSQLNDLTQQLSSGKKSNSYAGLGIDRGFATGLRAQLSALSSYADTATNVNTRISVANLSLQSMINSASTTKAAAIGSAITLDNTGQTAGQKTGYAAFLQSVAALNTQSGGRYLFSGRATDTPATAPADDILNGTSTKAGLKQVISERNAADLGVGAMGRLVVSSAAPTQVTLSEEAAGLPFGMKLASVSGSFANGGTISAVGGSPASTTIDLGATNPAEGDKINIAFTMPDGTSEQIQLTATSTVPTPAGSFAIGANSTATAANLSSALTSSIQNLSNTSLVAASAVHAGNDFFDEPPMRVGTSPFNTATTLVGGTPTNTVSWYTGETGTDPARGTAVARVDQSITVQYGARADEQAFRNQLQTLAVYAAVTTSSSNPNANEQVTALNQRITANLATIPGAQTIQGVQADFAGAQAAVKAATDRQTQTSNLAQTMLDSIEGINDNEVATKILALQTSLQASYQTTAQLYQTSLLKYLPL